MKELMEEIYTAWKLKDFLQPRDLNKVISNYLMLLVVMHDCNGYRFIQYLQHQSLMIGTYSPYSRRQVLLPNYAVRGNLKIISDIKMRKYIQSMCKKQHTEYS